MAPCTEARKTPNLRARLGILVAHHSRPEIQTACRFHVLLRHPERNRQRAVVEVKPARPCRFFRIGGKKFRIAGNAIPARQICLTAN